MKPKRPSKLFVGIGNVLRHDDGVGVRAAEVLASVPLPGDVDMLDGGTFGLGLASALAGRALVVVADAIDAGAHPGTIFELTPRGLVPYLPADLSLHDAHLLNALDEAGLEGTAPHRVIVLAVQVQDVSEGIGLSPEVAGSLNRLVERAAVILGIPRTGLAHCQRAVSPWAC